MLNNVDSMLDEIRSQLDWFEAITVELHFGEDDPPAPDYVFECLADELHGIPVSIRYDSGYFTTR